MAAGWMLLHDGTVYALPNLSVARFVQRAIARFAVSGDPEVVRFSTLDSVEVVTVVIDESSRVGRRVRR